MAMTLDSEQERAEQQREIEAVLDAMEDAAPGAKAEYLDGVYVLNRPIVIHQRVLMRLALTLGERLPSDLEVLPDVRVRDATTWIIPDLVVVSRDLDGTRRLLDPDEIVVLVEVLSPSTKGNDRGPKLEFCRRHRIDYWIVTPLKGGSYEIEAHDFGAGRVGPPPAG